MDTKGLVCILSRKPLRNITRVPRMARALSEAGYGVTVVSLGLPVPELREMCPAVDYRQVTVRPMATRIQLALRRRIEKRRRRRSSAERAYREAEAAGGFRAFAGRQWRLRGAPLLRSSASLIRKLLVVTPCACALQKSNETFGQAWRGLAASDTLEIMTLVVMQWRQSGVTRAFAAAAEKAVRDRRFDAVQAHDNYALAAARRLAARDNAKLIYDAVELTAHRLSTNFTRFEVVRERRARRREAAIFGKADLVITIGDGLADWYARHHSVRYPVVIRNCRYFWPYEVDRRLRADAGVGPEQRLVVWFGGAYPEQGIEILIDAVRYMAPHIHVAIVAFALPSQVPYVEVGLPRRAAELGVGDRVHVLPPRGPNDLVQYVSGADLGVIPRPSEYPNNFFSMPNKFLEMVMARLPIAVSRVGDMVEAIQLWGIGDVFDERDGRHVAAVIERMLEPAALARLKANAMIAAEELTWERESMRYVAAVRSLMPSGVSCGAALRDRAPVAESTAR
jgi:glycosyltransferase involved in cell wall biosynthesis